jgi:hypothetical protein
MRADESGAPGNKNVGHGNPLKFMTTKALNRYAEGVGYSIPGLSLALQPWDQVNTLFSTLKGLTAHTPNAFSVNFLFIFNPRVVACAPTLG